MTGSRNDTDLREPAAASSSFLGLDDGVPPRAAHLAASPASRYRDPLLLAAACSFLGLLSLRHLTGTAVSAGSDRFGIVRARRPLQKGDSETRQHRGDGAVDAAASASAAHASPDYNGTTGATSGGNGTADKTALADATSDYAASAFWGSLDLEGEINCGEYKCLFRQNSAGEKAAYLVGSNYLGYQFEAETQMAWRLAEHLRSRFRAEHLFLEAPRKVVVAHEALEIFHNRTWRKHPREPMYSAGHFATVQKVRLAPEPKMILTTRRWTTFKWFYREEVTNKTAFVTNLACGVKVASDALREFPLLAYDFQIIVDSEGNAYQFDLDRTFLGGAYYRDNFERKFAKAYDRGMKFIGKMAAWISQEQQQKGGDDEEKRRTDGHDGERDGEVMLNDRLRNSSSLSCRALDAVNGMSGRIENEGREIVRPAKLMMVRLVQCVMFDDDARQHDESPNGHDDEKWNCTL